MQTVSTSPSIVPARLVPAVAGLLLTLLLAALDATIVATAMPSIAVELHAFDRYSWVSVVYLLASTVTVPIVGKLGDQYGRRLFLLSGTITFLTASVGCAFAGTFEQLVAFRVLQGIGAGTIAASVFAAVPRLFAPSARARVIGMFAGTYGLASILGPVLGGIITDQFGWRGVFWINVPIGLVALGLILIAYPADGATSRVQAVDYAGAAALVGGMTPLLLALLLGGRELAWGSTQMNSLLAAGVLMLGLFLWIERRAVEPIVPLDLLATRTLGTPVLGSMLMNACMLAVLLFAPLFVQGVIGQTATQSGGVLAPMTAAWVVASTASGQVIARLGRTRPLGIAGMATATLGLWLLAGMGPGTEFVVVGRNLIVVGVGLGTALSAFVVAAQNAVPVEQSGTATSLSTFARAIGGTIATAALGGLLASNNGTVGSAALPDALSRVFLVAAALAAAGVAAALLIREHPISEIGMPAPSRVSAAGRPIRL
jgi:EmrB/QacA subfamily drug resistance transporter